MPKHKLGPRKLRWFELQASIKDCLRLSRPPWTPELYKSYGTYSWYRSDKAAAELGYEVRPLRSIIRQ